jgi:2-succinyl-5-enolpyruvyl-6-hydroxy-3-cyclohexene-1-carboxylate synthase
MIYSTKKFAQLASFYCQENNIKNIIISPGSRNAPLTINFTNNPFFNCYSIVDERSAAFFALGIAQQTKVPTVLICTSGSALLNYYPAIAEAYYSDIPLIIMSADRPKHLLEIGDGQTIKQNNVFANHILKSINLNEKKSLIDNSLIVNKTIQISIKQKGPVHINIPFDEPLYETTKKPFEFPSIKSKENQSLLNEIPLEVEYLQSFADKWNNSTKKMVLVGIHYPSELLQIQINHLIKDPSVLVLTETTSNIHHKKTINGIDKLINSLDEENIKKFQPEILITIGGMIVSKKIKQFLRNYQPKEHWHINPKWELNTFHCLTEHFKISATLFFSQFFFLTNIKKSDYQNHFLKFKKIISHNHNKYIYESPFSDLKVFATLFNSFPNNKIHLQLANSTTIRYSQLFDLSKNLDVFCNRGTSGIDGSTSTAFGAALFKNEQTIFITGDISFFYDSNALWNKYLNPNIRIILINNSGGGIFRFIEGPKSTNSLDYFETTHNLNAEKLCEMHFIKYEKVSSLEELKEKLNYFFNNSDRPKLLEINTPREINDTILKNYFNFLKKNSYI